mmetsp:Transcript_60224/g.173769  ORF Transcript_60224/g.173769 Transcript_60224/m.173769 type:complete len:285 (+) Transcript_60224:2211-3065(+)
MEVKIAWRARLPRAGHRLCDAAGRSLVEAPELWHQGSAGSPLAREHPGHALGVPPVRGESAEPCDVAGAVSQHGGVRRVDGHSEASVGGVMLGSRRGVAASVRHVRRVGSHTAHSCARRPGAPLAKPRQGRLDELLPPVADGVHGESEQQNRLREPIPSDVLGANLRGLGHPGVRRPLAALLWELRPLDQRRALRLAGRPGTRRLLGVAAGRGAEGGCRHAGHARVRGPGLRQHSPCGLGVEGCSFAVANGRLAIAVAQRPVIPADLPAAGGRVVAIELVDCSP